MPILIFTTVVQTVPPADELERLKQLVQALESGAKIIRGGVNVTKPELEKLKRQIGYLRDVDGALALARKWQMTQLRVDRGDA